MSREAYQVPTGQGSNPAATGKSFDAYGGGSSNEVGPQMQYLCGDCGLKFQMRRGDAIRCKECGCRILYKERTKRSRRAYQVPTGQGSNPAATGKSFDAYGGGSSSEVGPQMQYLCGDCGLKFQMRRGDAIRCKECGCRILYKERTKRMVQFEAR
ncbi:hypothetical protein BN1723_007872 [Verticillium longisporum]|uniref:DNA-directed RNA polymerase I, II, and III subunit RPABC4 n=1 Tax=Verticillium longisporum TaxID=100787 RepID=A0A0G4NNJ6_VERLO|nr:hypothetical protein BN1723_007872 [Verticillium longisporum]